MQAHILKGEFILKCADDLIFDWIVQQRRFKVSMNPKSFELILSYCWFLIEEMKLPIKARYVLSMMGELTEENQFISFQ